MNPQEFSPTRNVTQTWYGSINPEQPVPPLSIWQGRKTATMPVSDTVHLISDQSSLQEPKCIKEFTISTTKREELSNKPSSSMQAENLIKVSIHRSTEEGEESKHYIKMCRVDGSVEENAVINIKNTQKKPAITYHQLIIMAINDSPKKELYLGDIYNWFEENIPYFKSNPDTTGKTWKNSIRHNLSFHKKLFKYRSETSSFNHTGHPWFVETNEVGQHMRIMKGRFKAEQNRSKQSDSVASGSSKRPRHGGGKNEIGSSSLSSSTMTSAQKGTAVEALPEGGKRLPTTTSETGLSYEEGEPKLKELKLHEVNDFLENEGLPVPEFTLATLGDDDL